MTYLELCNLLIMEAGITASPMLTVAGQTGEYGRVVNWINRAWLDLQAEHQDWQWLRKSTSFTTVGGQATYRVGAGLDINLSDFGMWAGDTFRNYVTTVGNIGEIFMTEIDYEDWRNGYQYGALRSTQSRPIVFAIGPDKSINVGPVAADGYTVTGDYYSLPVGLVADSDTPALPSQYHIAIVYSAMMMYGAFEAASEVYQRGATYYDTWHKRIMLDRLPQIRMAGALA